MKLDGNVKGMMDSDYMCLRILFIRLTSSVNPETGVTTQRLFGLSSSCSDVQIPLLQLRLSTVWHMPSGITICMCYGVVVANIILECSMHDRPIAYCEVGK